VAGRARGRGQTGADHADDDRAHGQVLLAPGVLVQHPLGEQHQHEQAGRERGLHDHEWRQQQRNDLQRPTEDRQAGAEQPARPAHEPPRERQAQVLAARSFLRVKRLQGYP